MKARFIEPAEVEADEAVAYFEQQLEGLGERFQNDLEHTVSLIIDYPLIGSPLTKRIRKFRLRKFRYNVVYVVVEDEIVIVAVAHHKKRPRYWRRRMTQIS
jgi:plasmid stabilization system protein ParE